MLFRPAFCLFLIYGITFGVTAQRPAANSTKDKWLDTEGLYYLNAKQNHRDIWAFVITRHGQTIPQKENDPDAPTKPGFYLGSQRYRFVNYSVTRTAVAFETVKINGRSFRFRGRVRRGEVCGIENVPELRGQLIEIKGATQHQTKVRFGHAVVC